MGEKVFDVAKRFVDSSLFLHLNTISNVSDTILNDAQYPIKKTDWTRLN